MDIIIIIGITYLASQLFSIVSLILDLEYGDITTKKDFLWGVLIPFRKSILELVKNYKNLD